MSRKKKTNRKKSPTPSKALLAKINQELAQVDLLLQRRQWAAAEDALRTMDQRYPNNDDVLYRLVNLSLDQNDMRDYLRYIESLARLRSTDPDTILGLAGAYLVNGRQVSSLQTFQRFLERWPDHPRVPKVREQVAELEHNLVEAMAETGLSGDDAFELALLHEEILTLLERSDMPRLYRVAAEFLRRKPDYPPVLNNLSYAYYLEGKLEKAIEISRQVLDFAPDNAHAHSSMVRYLCMLGDFAAAAEYDARLQALPATSLDICIKQVEAASFLGDDQAVLAAFAAAATIGIPAQGTVAIALLYHLAAVAALRQGDEFTAQQHWRQVITLQPGFEPARANLADLDRPIAERHAPWPFPLSDWINPQRFRNSYNMLQQMLAGSASADPQAMTRTVRRMLADQPGVMALIPVLLERGDPAGRIFALNVAIQAELPELDVVVRDFALSRHGPDELRNRAARHACDANLIGADPVRIWTQGEWREKLLMSFEITEAAYDVHSPEVEALLLAALDMIEDGRPDAAIETLEQALALEPGAPDLLNNLAVAYGENRDQERSDTLLFQLHQEHPDYLFASVAVARIHIRQTQLDAAEPLLRSLMQRKHFHRAEFAALAVAWIEFWVAKQNYDVARSWAQLALQVNPDDDEVLDWQLRLGME